MIKRLICMLLVLSTVLSLCACGKEPVEHEHILSEPETSEAVVEVEAAEKPVEVADASAMKLVKTVGGVHVRDDSDAELPVFANMNLYSGYHMGTGTKSYAWINLDDTKLLKMDELSNADLEKNGRKLKVTLSAGKIFFCVLESLEEDEELIFETPNATNSVLAVRGTTGIVEVVSDHETKITLLEGRVEGTAVSGSFVLETGKLADIIVPCKKGGHNVREEDSGIEIRDIDYEKDIPWFVIDEIQNNPDVKDKLEENGGFTDYPEGTTDEPVDETTHEYSYRQEFVSPTCVDEGYLLQICICGYSYKAKYVDPLGHQWGQWKTIKEPTVNETGVAVRLCSRCGTEETRTLPIVISGHTHSYTGEVTKQATCTSEGIMTYSCSCGDVYNEKIPMSEHVPSGAVEKSPPTCTEYEYDSFTCKICGMEKSFVGNPPYGHDWSSWLTVQEPTENSEGKAERTCSRCSSVEARTLPKVIPGHTHNYTSMVTKEPTCTTVGTMTYTCDCGDTYSENIDKVGHNFVESNRVECTCVEDGHIRYTCAACSITTISTITAPGHGWGDWITTKEPTETEEGAAERSCEQCGAKENRTLPALIPGHTHSYTGTVTKEPTCTSEGVKTYTCDCGDSYTENLNKAEHDYYWTTESYGTCDELGYIEYQCGVCGEKKIETFPPAPHTWGEWVNIQEPTEIADGYAERSCFCGSKQSKILPKLISDHTHQYSGEITKHPTCTMDGVMTYTCDCGASYTEPLTVDHSYLRSDSVESTCTKVGYDIYTCLICGGSFKVPKKDISHAFVMTEEKQPTCTEDGYTKYVCERCGEESIALDPGSAGHIWSSWETIQEATETAKGTAEHTCTLCGVRETTTLPELIPGHTHGYTGTVTKEPTCTSTGIMTYTCDCGGSYTQSVNPIHHNYVRTDYKEATCLEDGYIKSSCLMCGSAHTSYQNATGHHWSNWVKIQEPTETTEGVAVRRCDKCDLEETKILPQAPLDHVHLHMETVTKQPTCTSTGVRTYTCDCGDTYTDIIPICHSIVEDDVDPTCTQEGYRKSICQECGLIKTFTTLPIIDHTWGTWITIQNPTESTTGTAERTCTKCGIKETKTLPTLSTDHVHSYVGELTLKPTCTKDGWITYTCECGDKYDVSLPSTGHQFEETRVEPLCERDGYIFIRCTICYYSEISTVLPATGSHAWGEWETVREPAEGISGIACRTCTQCGLGETKDLAPLATTSIETPNDVPLEDDIMLTPTPSDEVPSEELPAPPTDFPVEELPAATTEIPTEEPPEISSEESSEGTIDTPPEEPTT